ncbi:hypothetical protein N657DRAFT_111870 [Parathielavia appendiculata]|uniref:Uncharacterized protein n=1 Tax=Parathielavia appendiculata TaxID=2587402 RepID=A0AAN6TVT5_9PEZI|nr:hypothetical protein N657DRAFT_111870 [Parathielavia appendiculata]
MESSRHVGAITVVNLSDVFNQTLVDKINAVPGLKTSTAFLTFLRANLVLQHSAMSSNVSTPMLGPQTLPPVPSSPLATHPPQGVLDDDDIPPLSLEILTARADKAAALRLVADSIAQQRQQAAFHLVFHPLPLAALIAALAAIYRYTWAQNTRHDLGTALMLASSACMTYLLAIRYVTSGYLRAAEELSWGFITNPSNGEEDLVLGTRYGADIIGALVLRLEPSEDNLRPNSNGSGGSNRSRKSHSRQNSLKGRKTGGTGVIRAWTTRLRYRGRGLGGDMLREAVRVTRERCGRDAEVGFAREHANSTMVLPEMFNRPFRKGEIRASRALEKVLAEWDGRRR